MYARRQLGIGNRGDTMAVYGGKLSPATAFGLDRDDTSWLDEHPETHGV
jgi:hypothetical protein